MNREHTSGVDINCDLGELENESGLATDLALLPWITSANVACGAHAGSIQRMQELAAACRKAGVAFGAHPGYADRAGFGRRPMELTTEEIERLVRDQISLALKVAVSEGIRLEHVKPHGALYNLAAIDFSVAAAIARAVRTVSPQSVLVGLSGSRLIEAGANCGLKVRGEMFADRGYQSDGTLASRHHPQGVLHDVALIADRAVEMIRNQKLKSVDGTMVSVRGETLCVHGDTSKSVEIAQCLYLRLFRENLLRSTKAGESEHATRMGDS